MAARPSRGRRVLAAALIALAVLAAGLVASPHLAFAQELSVSLVVEPSFATVAPAATVEFQAFICQVLDADGRPDKGADGVAGTDDDNCVVPLEVQWRLLGDIGTLSTETGPATILSATVPPGATQGSGAVLADAEDRVAGASVAVVPDDTPGTGRLAFLDGVEDETTELTQLRLGVVQALFLAALTDQVARREARGGQATRAELRLLRQLVPTPFRHRVVARDLPPGTGNAPVVATLTSFDPDGKIVDVVDVVLEPSGGELRMLQQIAFVDPRTRQPRLPDGRLRNLFRFDVPDSADGLVFLTAVVGGRIVAEAPNLDPAEAVVGTGQ